MKKIYEEAAEAIKSSLTCDKYLTKSKHGNYCCPFCGSGTGPNKSGALEYYPKTNTWHCFSCGESGDVIDLLEHEYNTDFVGVLKMAAPSYMREEIEKASKNEFSAPVDNLPGNGKKTAVKGAQSATEAPTEAPADYTEYYKRCEAQLPRYQKALSYLAARGISKETAAAFHVGFDPEADPANRPGAAAEEPKLHPAPRIIIPTGRAHYVGRSIDPNTPARYAKMNPKDGSPGIVNAAAIYSAKTVFVTEGAFDAMSLAELGGAAVALNSAGNGNLLLEQLKSRPASCRFIVCFDNDKDPKTAERTRAAAAELTAALVALGYDSRAYNVAGEYHDINDRLQADREGLKMSMERALRADYLQDFFDTIQTEAYKPSSTGLSFFDDLLGGGPMRQTLLLLMAAPGAGKTTLAQQLAEAMAEHKRPVLYLNFEMSREQMLAKAISARLAIKGKSRRSATEILQGYKWSDDDREIISAAIDEYRQNIFPYLQYNPQASGDFAEVLEYLRSTGEKASAAGKEAPAVIVDYLHLLSSSKGLESAEIIKQAMQGFKQYAIKYNTFVVAIVAVNRDSMKRGQLSMFSGRDSSSIEYTADYILTLNHYAIDNGDIDPQNEKEMELENAKPWRQMILRLPKYRFGLASQSVKLYFNPAQNRFVSADFIPDGAEPFNMAAPATTRKRA